MIEVIGEYGKANVKTFNIDDLTLGQVYGMMNEPLAEGMDTVIHADCHLGKGSVVGTSMVARDGKFKRLSPQVIGVDLSCGILMKSLGNVDIDLTELEKAAREVVPTGFSANSKIDKALRKELEDILSNLVCRESIPSRKFNKIVLSCGSLGGGNHFIELAEDETGEKWISVHTGSRGLGTSVANYWQKVAVENRENIRLTKEEAKVVRDKCIAEGRKEDIDKELNKIRAELRAKKSKTKELSFLEGEDMNNYLHDTKIAHRYANLSRESILNKIINRYNKNTGENIKVLDSFDSVHNYIDVENAIIRKGATSAQLGERLVIPLNMKDGSLICVGKGNKDFAYSAPHGAGRIMSRSKAKEEINLDDYELEMTDVYTTSVNKSTLDEAPGVYKDPYEIMELIEPTVDILHHLKPLWNMKDSSEDKGEE